MTHQDGKKWRNFGYAMAILFPTSTADYEFEVYRISVEGVLHEHPNYTDEDWSHAAEQWRAGWGLAFEHGMARA